MTDARRVGVPDRLTRLADAVLLPCFDGLAAPEWVRRRVAGGMGGVCLFARNVRSVDQVAALSAELADLGGDVVIAIDEEAGDVTRLDAATGSRFPGAFALGRVDDTEMTAIIGQQVGTLLRAAGVSLNLAPCADVTINPDNPVIGSRSFGTDPDLVSRHTAAWIRGQQAAGVAACAKHFPGHGDTSADSPRSVAVLSGDLESLRRDALPPFAAAVAAGTAAIMSGHLLAPAVDDVPATVSRRWLTEILRGELDFTGVIVTDALEMAGVADLYGIPGAAVRSLAAGADLLCIGGETRPEAEIDAIRDAIVDAVLDGTLPEERLAEAAERCRTVGFAAARRAADPSARPRFDADGRESLSIALRATQTAGPLPALREPILVVRCIDTPNIAVGMVPWGPAAALGAREILLRDGDAIPVEDINAAGSVLVVTRDRHRFPWMVRMLDAMRDLRPDTVLIEMGITGVSDVDAPAIASFGATQANTWAIVRLLSAAASPA
jgi:beta-N-acetylhexosaminidase